MWARGEQPMNRPGATPVKTEPSGISTDAAEDDEVEQAGPNAEHLVAEGVVLATAEDPHPEPVAAYWRRVPDEELVSCEVSKMVAATRSHLELAQQRVPGELKLRLGLSVTG